MIYIVYLQWATNLDNESISLEILEQKLWPFHFLVNWCDIVQYFATDNCSYE